MMITDELEYLIKDGNIANVDNVIDVLESYSAEIEVEKQIIIVLENTVKKLNSSEIMDIKSNNNVPYF